MTYSYEGIGHVVATFMADGVQEGQVAKICATETMGACAAGDTFGGYVMAVARDGTSCAVALHGMVTTSYSGNVPILGWCELVADGNGGVSYKTGGLKCLVVDLDAETKTVTFML